MAGEIIVPSMPKDVKDAIEAEIMNKVPLRILCPKCQKIYTLYIESFDQGLWCILGQMCPYCKRFIRESDDPEKILVDLKDVRDSLGINKDREKKR